MVSSGIEVRMGGGWKSQRDSMAYHQLMCLLLGEKRRQVQCGVEFILASRPVLTAHPDSKAVVNCFQ